VFDLFHFDDGRGGRHDLCVGIATAQKQLQVFGFQKKQFTHPAGIHKAMKGSRIQFIQNDQTIFEREYFPKAFLPCPPGGFDMSLFVTMGMMPKESFTHGLDVYVGEHFNGLDFTVGLRRFDELEKGASNP